MKIEVIQGGLADIEAGALLLPVAASKQLEGVVRSLDKKLGGGLSSFLSRDDFRARRNETAILYPVPGLIGAERIVLVGVGDAERCTAEVIRQAAGEAAKRARSLGATTLLAPPMGGDWIEHDLAAQATVEGIILGLYRFLELKTEPPSHPEVEQLTIAACKAADLEAVIEGARVGRILAESTNLARDLVNRPANVATPTHLAEVAHAIAV